MGFCEAPKSVLQEVAEANWQSVIDASKAVAGQFHGLTLLLDFCRDADGR